MPTINERLDDIADRIGGVATQVAVIADRVETMRTATVVPRLEDHGRRLRALEQWRWAQLGAAAAAGAAAAVGAGAAGAVPQAMALLGLVSP